MNWRSTSPAPTLNATDISAAIIGARFGLTECLARVVCELAGIGGQGGAA